MIKDQLQLSGFQLIPLQHDYDCPICGKSATFAVHVVNYHDNRLYFTCLACGMDFVSIFPELIDTKVFKNYSYFPNFIMKPKGYFQICHR